MLKRLLVVALAVFGLTVLLCIPAEGSGCRAVHRCAPPVRVVEEKVVVEAVAVVPVVSAFLPAAVVAYGAAYAPGSVYPGAVAGAQPGYAQQPGQQDAFLAGIQRLEQRLGAMEQRLGLVSPQAQVTPMPQADTQQVQVSQQAQASGNLATLSAEKQRELLRRVYTEDTKIRMPKSKPALTDEELGLVVQWIASPGPPAPEVVKLFSTRCASCHQSGREGSGGGFVLTLK